MGIKSIMCPTFDNFQTQASSMIDKSREQCRHIVGIEIRMTRVS